MKTTYVMCQIKKTLKICHQNSIQMFTSVPKCCWMLKAMNEWVKQYSTTTYLHQQQQQQLSASANHIMHSFCLIWGHSTCPPSAYLFAHWSLDSDSNGKLKRKLTHRFVPIINLPGCCCLCLPVTMLLYQVRCSQEILYFERDCRRRRRSVAKPNIYASFHTLIRFRSWVFCWSVFLRCGGK